MPSLLEVENLDAFYGATRVLFGVTLAVEKGSITAILGSNGAGKTTILRAICRMVSTRGQIRFGGEPLDRKATEQVVRMGIAHVPDGRGTFGPLTVEENLELGAYGRKNRSEVAADLESAYLRFPRLKERRNQQAGSLSGGEQQMLAIGRALMSRPSLLLLDEPSFGLAPMIIEEIFALMQEVRATNGVSVLLVEQNAAQALAVSDHAYVLETGRVRLSGESSKLADHEEIRKSYLGA